jgi:hypothetical protein
MPTTPTPAAVELPHQTAEFDNSAVQYGRNSRESRRHRNQRGGFTYLLHKSSAGWRIHEIIATDLDKLISAD